MVGRGGIITSLACPHIPYAMLLCVVLHFHAYIMLLCCALSCSSTHTFCYACLRSRALPHILHATLLCVLSRFHTCIMLHCCVFCCTSTNTSCYAAVHCLALPHLFWRYSHLSQDMGGVTAFTSLDVSQLPFEECVLSAMPRPE